MIGNREIEMHAMPHLGTVQADLETRTRAGEFVGIARTLVASAKTGGLLLAARMAESHRMSPRVVSILKSAVASGTTSGWGASISEYQDTVSAFLESLSVVGAFDRMLGDMQRVPLKTRVAITTVGITGSIVGEAQATPISSMTLAAATTDPLRAIAIIALSDELARLTSGSGQLFARELRNAIAIVTDQQFITTITTGITPIASSGSTVAAVRIDLNAAVGAIETGASSKLYVLVTADNAKRLATSGGEDGAAWPEMSPSGGRMAGMEVIVTDGLSAGQMVVVDANAIAASAGSVELDAVTEASVEMNTTPTSPPTTSTILHSLWQHNEVGLKVSRHFSAERLHDSAVALVSGAVYSPQ
jgi:hypothetical protein